MKGLLVKDIRLMKNQITFMALIIVICGIFLVMGEELSFVTGYLAAILSIMVINTLKYDEFDNGYNFLFTLPVSRRVYVMEKYLFGGIVILLLLITGMILANVAPVIQPEVYQRIQMSEIMITMLLIAVIIQSVTIPLQLQFGCEKSRMALGVLIAGVFIAVTVMQKALPSLGAEFTSAFSFMDRVQPRLLLAGACGAMLILLAVSCAVSVQIMKKKQF